MTSIIPAAAFLAKMRAGEACCIVDVRTLPEVRVAKLAAGCVHVPLDELDAAQLRSQLREPAQPFYVLCKSGMRARKAAAKLAEAGLDQAVVVDGGLDACMACGAEVVRGEGVSLERQVRIAAGTLVLGGVLLGASVTREFYALAGFVGAGLIFAGISGWCGMALLLAKAPWNK